MLTALGICTTTAHAEGGSFVPPQYSNFMSFGVGVLPDYIGSDDDFVGAAPFGVLSLGDNKFFSILANSVYLNLSTNENLRFRHRDRNCSRQIAGDLQSLWTRRWLRCPGIWRYRSGTYHFLSPDKANGRGNRCTEQIGRRDWIYYQNSYSSAQSGKYKRVK